MPAEAGFAKDVKSRQTCMSTLSFLEVNLFFRQSTFLPSLAHMAFWTIRCESSQTCTFFLPVETSKVFFCTAFFNLQFIIPVAFLKILWAPSKTMHNTMAFQSWPIRGPLLFYLFLLRLPQIFPDFFILLAFYFCRHFGKWGNKFSAGTNPWIR